MGSFFRHFGMAVWSMFCISLSIILMIILFNRNIPLIMARTMWSPGILWFAGAKLEILGQANIPKTLTSPIVVVSNHKSFLDIPCICRALPLNLHWTAKRQVKRMPFFGLYMMATGMIFIDRSNTKKAIKSMKRAAELIKTGKNVIIFPEGKRSLDNKTGIFKKGAFRLAVDSGADIVPVAINGTDKIWSKKNLKLHPGNVRLAIGNLVPTKEVTDIVLLTNSVRDKVVSLGEWS